MNKIYDDMYKSKLTISLTSKILQGLLEYGWGFQGTLDINYHVIYEYVHDYIKYRWSTHSVMNRAAPPVPTSEYIKNHMTNACMRYIMGPGRTIVNTHVHRNQEEVNRFFRTFSMNKQRSRIKMLGPRHDSGHSFLSS